MNPMLHKLVDRCADALSRISATGPMNDPVSMRHVTAVKAPTPRFSPSLAGAKIVLGLLVLGLGFQQSSWAQTESDACGSLANAYGPFDFRVDRDKLVVVETHHFTPSVQNLIRGATGTLGQDLDYTLRAYPNHPGALSAMAKLADRDRTDRPNGSTYTVDCWFIRALRFRSNDHLVRMLYANTLIQKKRTAEASAQLDIVANLLSDNPFSFYNLGMLYFDLGEFDKAAAQARKAQELGFPRMNLIEKLKVNGHWEAAPVAPATAASASSKPD